MGNIEPLQLVRVTEAELPEVHSLWQDAYRFMLENGIDQWVPDQLTMDAVKYVFSRSEMYLVRNGSGHVGTFFLIESDPDLWGEDSVDGNAMYLHRLVVSRQYAGQGMGLRLLALAEQHLRNNGKRYFRLDCMGDTPSLTPSIKEGVLPSEDV